MNITSSNIAMAILEKNAGVIAAGTKLKTLINEVKAYNAGLTAEQKAGFLGILYSGSLFDDATDNIFYQVQVGKTEDGLDFYADVRFTHNSTQLYTGFSVSPAVVQAPGQTTGAYALSVMNNVTFPRYLTHLVYQSITKLNTELVAGFQTYPDVALLHTSNLAFR